MKPIVDHDLCIGCGLCEGMDGVVFKVLEGKSEVQVQDAEGNMIDYDAHRDTIDKSIGACPVQAISWGGAEEEVPEVDSEDNVVPMPANPMPEEEDFADPLAA